MILIPSLTFVMTVCFFFLVRHSFQNETYPGLLLPDENISGHSPKTQGTNLRGPLRLPPCAVFSSYSLTPLLTQDTTDKASLHQLKIAGAVFNERVHGTCVWSALRSKQDNCRDSEVSLGYMGPLLISQKSYQTCAA